jgi:hypothetical protein
MSAIGLRAEMTKYAINVAFGGKADMTFCGISLSRSLLGVTRTWLVAAHMSAFDPKRTLVGGEQPELAIIIGPFGVLV